MLGQEVNPHGQIRDPGRAQARQTQRAINGPPRLESVFLLRCSGCRAPGIQTVTTEIEIVEKRTVLERLAEELLAASAEYDPDGQVTIVARRQDIYVGAEAIARVRDWCDGPFDQQAMRDLGKRIEAASS